MFGLLKELMDRFIEFVICRSKGETKEQQTLQALRVCVSLIPFLIMMLLSVSTKAWNTSTDLRTLSTTVMGLESLLDPNAETNPLNKLIRINDTLTKKINGITMEYIEVSKENHVLKDNNIRNEEEIRKLKRDLELTLSNKK